MPLLSPVSMPTQRGLMKTMLKCIQIVNRIRERADAVAYAAEREADALSKDAPRVSALLLRLCHGADAVEAQARRLARGLERLNDCLVLVECEPESQTVLEDPRDT
jgi:hypothetical protein